MVTAAALAAVMLVSQAISQPQCTQGAESRNIGRESGERAQGAPLVTWIVVIAVDSYEHVRPLQYCTEDAKLLVDTLTRRGQRDRVRVLQLVEGRDAKLQPTRENVLREVPAFLKQVRPQDAAIVFFSGHGFLDSAGGAFLAPIDCDPGHLGLTGVRVAELRGYLESCPAGTKLLVLDACHAGSVKGAEVGLTARELEADLAEAVAVYTLASCQAKQQSFVWEDKKQGLFTYWLNRGLEGAADENGDGTIAADELFRFVQLLVTTTSKIHFRQEQTPARIVGPTLPETLEVLRLRPEAVGAALNRLAELVHEQILHQGLRKVGVLEFTSLLDRQEVLGGDLGMFGQAAAEKVEQHLVEHCGTDYVVADRRQLSRATKGVTIEDLGDPAVLGRLPGLVPKLDAVLVGSFLRIGGGERLRLNCKLLGLSEGNVLASVSSVIDVDEDFWALTGRSADFRPSLIPAPDAPRPVECLRQRHPLLQSEFPYHVALRVGGQEKKLFEGRDGKLYVGLRPGDEYEILIRNKINQYTFVQVFADGLNVLGATRQFPEEAWPWLFEPDGGLRLNSWHRPEGPAKPGVFVGGRFVVVEPSQSLAARQKFGEDLGQITVLFYEALPPGTARSRLGTGEGEQKQRHVYTLSRSDLKMGNMLAAVTIHYVHEDALRSLD